MWGQVRAQDRFYGTLPIIPTRVGTSYRQTKFFGIARDHPHACGDKSSIRKSARGNLGSSPRVWGQDEVVLTEVKSDGIIPTRVGTSLAFVQKHAVGQDHPHACGDKLHVSEHTSRKRGSSPRVWGQDRALGLGLLIHRIIPTRVGTRSVGHSVFQP